MNNKGADQTARMHRLVCACFVRKPPKTGFLASRPILVQVSHRLEKYLNLWDCLEMSLKLKFALKSTGKALKSIEKSLSSTIFCST